MYTNREAEYRNAIQILMASPNWKILRKSKTTKELVTALESIKDKTIFDTRALEILKNIEENNMSGIRKFVNEMLEVILSEIERKDMPQVRGKEIPEMLEIFDENDIPYKKGVVECKLLKPVQEDFIPEKRKSIKDSLLNGTKLNPIVISQDGYIMDGHHRWLACKDLYGDSYKMPVIQILLPKADSLKLFDVVSDKVNENIITEKVNKVIAVYAGRFQPFHTGHNFSYENLVSRFGKENVYITTSDKTGPDSPFNFNEKKKIMTKMFGIPSSHIINTKQPYKPTELENKLKGNALVFAVGEKDPTRFANATLYKPGMELDPVPAYYYTFVPQLEVKIGNYTISGTVVRNLFKTGSDKAKEELFKRLYGKFDKEIFNLLNKRITSEAIEESPIQERISINAEIKLIAEGGAYGHMSHPFDDWQLTFGDLRQIIETALQGNLEMAKEKTDGQNLFISWVDGKLVAARNKSQLKNFGKEALNKDHVAQMFAGRGAVQDAFVFAMEDLEKAISRLSQKQRDKIFDNGHKFMNLEIIYPETTNVIPYGTSMLVFHNSVEVDQDGNQSAPSRQDATILAGMIKQVNQDIQKNFQIKYPAEPKISLGAVSDLSARQPAYLAHLDSLRKEFNLSDTDTIALYHQRWWEDFVTNQAKTFGYAIPNNVFMELVKRWAFGDKSFTINDMKKEIDNEKFLDWAINFDKKDHEKQVEKNMEPFEILFLKLGAEILQNASNFLAANPEESMQKIKNEIDKAIKDIEGTKDVRKIGLLKQQLAKLQALGGNNVIVPTEGIVFTYKGNVYKLTGAFAPVNTILGLLKYVR